MKRKIEKTEFDIPRACRDCSKPQTMGVSCSKYGDFGCGLYLEQHPETIHQDLKLKNGKLERKKLGSIATPGPWLVMGNQREGGHFDCVLPMADNKDFQANAALIAAAPDLLAALKHAAEIINGEWGHDLSEGSMSGVPQDIRAAIAKAEGK